MSTATLSKTRNMVIVTLPAECSQEEYGKALDWANAHAACTNPVVVDHGDVCTYMWPAAA